MVADKNIEYTIRGFLQRDRFHLSIGCSPFEFNEREDLLVAVGDADPGLFKRAGNYARAARTTHSHVVIALDADWHGSPGAAAMQVELDAACERVGWQQGAYCGLVLNPEIENWIWQDNAIVETAVGHSSPPTLRAKLAAENVWPDGMPKPPRPKEALEQVLRANRIPRSSNLYARISSRVSVQNCVDPAFRRLVTALQTWFP